MSEALLVVELAALRYALPVQQIREVVPRATLTAVPGAPAAVLGVLSLRGVVLPVLDLRQRLGLPALRPVTTQCIIVADVDGLSVGLLADAVGGIVTAADHRAIAASADTGALVKDVRELDGSIVPILDPGAIVGPVIARFLSSIIAREDVLTTGPDRRSLPQAGQS